MSVGFTHKCYILGALLCSINTSNLYHVITANVKLVTISSNLKSVKHEKI
jgi:hypothetical protein